MMPFDSYYSFINDIENALSNLLAVTAVISVLCIITALAGYILQSIAMTRIGRRRGIKAAWLAWIPIANVWTTGAIADDHDAQQGRKRNFRATLLILIIIFILAYVFLFVGAFSMAGELEAVDTFSEELAPIVIKLMVTMYTGMFAIVFAATVFSAIHFICIFKIFESLSPRRCVLHFILGILIPFYQPICLFCLRNKGYPYLDEIPVLPETPAEIEKGWYEA